MLIRGSAGSGCSISVRLVILAPVKRLKDTNGIVPIEPARMPRARATAGTVMACSRVIVTIDGTAPGNPQAEDNPE